MGDAGLAGRTAVPAMREDCMIDRKKAEEALRKLAEQEKMNVEEIREEIQRAIDAAYDNPDPKYRKEWSKVPFAGERPTPEDVIMYVVREMKERGTGGTDPA